MVHERYDEKTPKDEQRTPPSLFKKLNARFPFNVDLATSRDSGTTNSLCPDYFEKNEQGGFLSPHAHLGIGDVGWCNPPFSAGKIDPFLKKIFEETRIDGVLKPYNAPIVVCLLPADISTRWWNWCMLADEWIRIKGRVIFNHADGTPIKGSPKFGCMAVVFKDTERRMNLGFPVISEMTWK